MDFEITFKQFILKFKDEDNFLGDIAHDIKNDQFFDTSNDLKTLEKHFIEKHENRNAPKLFRAAIKIYLRIYDIRPIDFVKSE